MIREFLRDVIGAALLTAGIVLVFYGGMTAIFVAREGAAYLLIALPLLAIGWRLA